MAFSQEEIREAAQAEGHSEEFIKDVIYYYMKLQAKNLPVIFSTYHLSILLDIPYQEIGAIIHDRKHSYKFYEIRKKIGGTRQIIAPTKTLKYIQRFILSEIISKVEVSDNACAYVKGKSISSNAVVHSGKQSILKIDLIKFFDCISEKRVYWVFRRLGYAKNLSVDLAKLVTVPLPEEYISRFTEHEQKLHSLIIKQNEAVLPQGAPTSPALSNIVLQTLDLRLDALASKNDLSYTRYADDITFSGEINNLPKFSLLKKIIGEEGFYINWRKVGIYQRGRKQIVTGLTVSNGVHVPRKFKEEVAKHLYACNKFGVANHMLHNGIANKSYYKEWLLGKVLYIHSIEPAIGQKLLAKFRSIAWPI